KEDRLARKSPEPPPFEEPLGTDTQRAPWISEMLARQEFDETQTIRPNLFDPIEDKKTQSFQRENVLPPAPLVPREIIVAAEISPESRVLELESEHTTHPLPPTTSSSGTKKFILAFFVLVLLGGGIAGAVLMTLDSPPLEKEVALHTKHAHATETSSERTSDTPVDPGLVAEVATGRVASALEHARIKMTSSGEAMALKAEAKEKEETFVTQSKRPRAKASSRKAAKPKVEKVAKKDTDKEKSASPPDPKKADKASPAVAAKKDASTTTTPAPRPKETSPPKKEKEEYRFFGVP
ncbi:MAG: hypothetical protein VX475_15735, partial [Myxococcota bacterium]|nr:hypothetical protein [Myxococcota bacterium]